MARAQTVHICSQCGLSSAQWHGQCPGCEAWNTLVEERSGGGDVARNGMTRGRPGARTHGAPLVPLSQVAAAPVARLQTGIGELDRVLGGGLVPGSLVLLGGSPGIGKSTLTNMAPGNSAGTGHKTL